MKTFRISILTGLMASAMFVAVPVPAVYAADDNDGGTGTDASEIIDQFGNPELQGKLSPSIAVGELPMAGSGGEDLYEMFYGPSATGGGDASDGSSGSSGSGTKYKYKGATGNSNDLLNGVQMPQRVFHNVPDSRF